MPITWPLSPQLCHQTTSLHNTLLHSHSPLVRQPPLFPSPSLPYTISIRLHFIFHVWNRSMSPNISDLLSTPYVILFSHSISLSQQVIVILSHRTRLFFSIFSSTSLLSPLFLSSVPSLLVLSCLDYLLIIFVHLSSLLVYSSSFSWTFHSEEWFDLFEYHQLQTSRGCETGPNRYEAWNDD